MANLNMNDFVHWDKVAAATDGATTTALDQDSENIGLVLANVAEDDFSFCALEHFSNNASLSFDATAVQEPLMHPVTQPWYETSDAPCNHCLLGGYSCKKIREGCHKGYCTSCVALRIECSLAEFEVATADPQSFTNTTSNSILSLDPWPTKLLGEHPNMIPSFGESAMMESTSSLLDVPSLSSSAQGEDAMPAPKPIHPPKVGARFSRESLRYLKNWLSTHHRHPYPSEEEKEVLQRQTGLNKKQITDWLANARRRGKVQAPRSISPHFRNPGSSIDIPKRRGTPALEAMNPLQRWAHSPPEHEPASVTAIARAVTASSSALSSGLNSPYSLHYTDDGSSKSLCNQSSISSAGTSHSSGGSFGSAYSHGSRNSWGSLNSAPFNSRGRRRRRRRAAPKKEAATGLAAPLKTFQCTFCTETFRTKHDWQRHEKSLHLSLERWVCAPDGPRAINPDTKQLSCVFCGIANPDDAHIETHNHSACQERSLEERTFYRKDHLNQHLRLVHNVKFSDWSMQPWKVATPEIRSRCGFCGIVMDTWTIRVDHLAEHFKTGYSMADWKGDWGFDVPVLDMVENSIPPYLIHHERQSPLPYIAQQAPPESPRNAYGLIKLELAFFSSNHWDQHDQPPTDDDMTLEGCRIIFASELLSLQGIATQASWLRDIIMDSDKLTQKARFGPLRGAAENRLHILKINGKDNLFEQCPMEFQLHQFVKAKKLLGLTPMDSELQEEACRIVGRIEESCTHPSEIVANWLLRRIKCSTSWLAPFRQRESLPRSEDVKNVTIRSKDLTSIDSTIHSYSRLECELGDYLTQQRMIGKEPSDEDLQRQSRIIIYEFDDGWNQTAADNIDWLAAFRRRHPASGGQSSSVSGTSPAASSKLGPQSTVATTATPAQIVASPDHALYCLPTSRPIPFFLNDANCYRRLARELKRWVASVMSPNNPNRHNPTDEEIRYQARWILYDDDDPWNQTAADNAEWLERFKRDVSIVNDERPGLPPGNAWALEQGGTGFAPPYACPKGHVERFDKGSNLTIRGGSGQIKALQADCSAANKFLDTLTSPNQRPAVVFCSRELEHGLIEFVEQHAALHGTLPTDDAMMKKGKELLASDMTAADDPVLLRKFKEYALQKLPSVVEAAPPPAETNTESENENDGAGAGALVTMTDAELDNILQEMEFEFDTDFTGVNDGGVSLI